MVRVNHFGKLPVSSISRIPPTGGPRQGSAWRSYHGAAAGYRLVESARIRTRAQGLLSPPIDRPLSVPHPTAAEGQGGSAPQPIARHSEVWSYIVVGGSDPHRFDDPDRLVAYVRPPRHCGSVVRTVGGPSPQAPPTGQRTAYTKVAPQAVGEACSLGLDGRPQLPSGSPH
jgi:hypothetical protein